MCPDGTGILRRYAMSEFMELMLIVFGIYLMGVLTGVVALGVYIYLYLKPGESVQIRCNDEIQ